jgi:DNA-binding transcriptional MerR regulator/predicted transcriptional regulator YdeE
MKDLFTIGEIAKLFDVNIRTLRYYDEIDLLKPEYIDATSNYRYYSTRQFERLNTIKYLRALNMPLSKISDFFRDREVDTLISILKQQKEEIAAQKYELELIERKIQNRLCQIEDAIHSNYNLIEEKWIPQRKIAIVKKDIKVDEDIELPIVELGRANGLNTAIFLGKVALSIAKENLSIQRFDEFSYVIVIVEEEDCALECKQSNQSIPEGNYLSLQFQGTHKDSKEYYLKLLDYLKTNQYHTCGNAIEITMIDYGMTNDSSKFVTEIQIPFEKD